MRTKRKIAGQNWEFDGSTITVRIPMTFKRRGGRKVIIAPDGGDAWAPAKPRPDETLIRALARAHRWKRMLEEGRHRSAAEIAEAESVTRSFVNRLLRLTLLAPDIQEAILDGCQPKGLQLNDLALLPDDWGGAAQASHAGKRSTRTVRRSPGADPDSPRERSWLCPRRRRSRTSSRILSRAKNMRPSAYMD
ncbi:MAG: hypothetical protein ACXW3M_12830 [Rhodoplanes sp.]